MPPSVYTSPEFLAHELKHVFAREWVTVGRASALSKAGDYLTYSSPGSRSWSCVTRLANCAPCPTCACYRMSTLVEGLRQQAGLIVCPYTPGPTISTER